MLPNHSSTSIQNNSTWYNNKKKQLEWRMH